MDILLAADHAGFEMKEHIKEYLEREGYAMHDVGAHSFDPNDDYPQYMQEAAELVARMDSAFGIVFGYSGQGEAIAVNRFRGVRAMVYVAVNPDLVKLGREHNNANILSLGAGFLTNKQAEEAVKIFLSTPFPGDARHARRIMQIDTDI